MNLDDLPRWSPWPARLLALSLWKVPNRTVEKVGLEYDKDKYAKCLEYYTGATPLPTIETVRQFEQDKGSPRCVSLGNDLVLMTIAEVRSRYNLLLLETMRQEVEKSSTIIELGCGYGYNLFILKQNFKDKQFLGGEYSENAVHLAADLFRGDEKLKVSQFNFYDTTYEILEGAQPPITLFTSHAVEQLPLAGPFFQALLQYRNKLGSVFHFEPLYELGDPTMLGLLRRRYTEANDYNRDLLLQLRRSEIRIVQLSAKVFGLNPLNPTSVIQWEYEK